MDNTSIDSQVASTEAQQNSEFYNNLMGLYELARLPQQKNIPPYIPPRRMKDYWPKHITADGKR